MGMSDKQERTAATMPLEPLTANPKELAAEILQPDTTEKLLNAQLTEALFLMRFASHLFRWTPGDSFDRGCFIDYAERMMRSSVSIAERIAKLRSGDAEPPKRVHYIVEHIEGGGGKRIPENE